MTSKKNRTLGFTDAYKHPIKSGRKFDKMFGKPVGGHKVVSKSATVEDTIHYIAKFAKQYHSQSQNVSAQFKSGSLTDQVAAIEDWIQTHIPYRMDGQSDAGARQIGDEELSTPNFMWHNRHNPNTPADCDDISAVMPSTILFNLGIKHYIRMADYGYGFQHVYTVIPLNQNSPLNPNNNLKREEYLVIDPVLQGINNEVPFVKKYDVSMNRLTVLSGAPKQHLGTAPAFVTGVFALVDEINWSKIGQLVAPIFSVFNRSQGKNDSWYKDNISSKPDYKLVMDNIEKGKPFDVALAYRILTNLKRPGGWYESVVKNRNKSGYNRRRYDIITGTVGILEKAIGELGKEYQNAIANNASNIQDRSGSWYQTSVASKPDYRKLISDIESGRNFDRSVLQRFVSNLTRPQGYYTVAMQRKSNPNKHWASIIPIIEQTYRIVHSALNGSYNSEDPMYSLTDNVTTAGFGGSASKFWGYASGIGILLIAIKAAMNGGLIPEKTKAKTVEV